MAYLLFLLVNAALFLRPEEIIPNLNGAHLYEVFILSCLAVSLPRVASNLFPLQAHPISACVIGLIGAGLISNLLNYQSREELDNCFAFAKLLMYYLLLVAVVDSPGKLRGFVYYLLGLILVLTTLALLRYYDVITIAALDSYAERQWEMVDEETGQTGGVLLRLCAAGIFANPNDLSRILVVGIMICLYGVGEKHLKFPRFVWLVLCLGLLVMFCHALALTHSRGGLLCLLASLLAMLWSRFGGRKTALLGLTVFPLLLVLFGGRQTQLSTSEGTGHQRIEIWSEGFAELLHAPLFGIGINKYGEAVGIAAHNSFVQSYTELGFVGGTFFVGAFYLAVLLPYLAGRQHSDLPEGELRRVRPYLIGIIAGYVMGLTLSSRNYTQPTFMMLGLAAIYLSFVGVHVPASVATLNLRLVRHIVLVSGLTVAVLYLFVRFSLARA
jgi:putative inorganic carbon (hco3(-)) transporter